MVYLATGKFVAEDKQYHGTIPLKEDKQYHGTITLKEDKQYHGTITLKEDKLPCWAIQLQTNLLTEETLSLREGEDYREWIS